MPPRRTKRPEGELPAESYPLRIPPDLRAALDAACRVSERSLNSEILFRLRRDLAADGKLSPMMLRQDPVPYKSEQLDQMLLRVIKELPADKQLALLQLLK